MGFIEKKINAALQPAINKAFKDTFEPILSSNDELRKKKEKEFLEMVNNANERMDVLNDNMQILQENLKELEKRIDRVEE